MSKFDIPTPSVSLKDRVAELPEWEKLDIIEVRVWSDSDFPKIKKILEWLNDYPLLVRIASAHRTPDAMVQLAKSFPNVQVSLEGEDENYTQVSEDSRELCKRLNIVTCIAAAGWSAHIAGMTASDTHIPVIWYPVPSRTNGQFESDASMRDMPPHKPNGVSAYESVIVQQAKAIYDFSIESSQGIYLDPNLHISEATQEVIDLIGIKITDTLDDNPCIWIHEHEVSDKWVDYDYISNNWSESNYHRDDVGKAVLGKTQEFDTPIAITNPTYSDPLNTDNRSRENAMRAGIIGMNRLTVPGLSMSTSVSGKTNLINSVIFAAEIVAKVNTDVRDALIEHRETLNKIVREKDMRLMSQQT